ncbi:MAG: hypothetical protein ACE15F_16395 [bacterium]
MAAFINSGAGWDLSCITPIWFRLVTWQFLFLQVAGDDVYVADGLKAAKEGRKRPGVKKLHQPPANHHPVFSRSPLFCPAIQA